MALKNSNFNDEEEEDFNSLEVEIMIRKIKSMFVSQLAAL